MSFRSLRTFVIWLVAFGAAPVAAADDPSAEADRLIRHGIELRRSHDEDAAQKEFQKAYDLVHTPRAAGQLGLAEHALGRWEDAQRHVSEAIHAPDDAWVAKNRSALNEALGTIEAHLGRVEVIGDPAGAMVSINGRDIGSLPLDAPVRVSAGQVYVEMRAPGYLSGQQTITLVGGQYQRVVIHLGRENQVSGETKAAPASKAQPSLAGPGPPAADEGPSSTRIALKWTAAGLAGAGLVTGIVFTILHSHNVTTFDNHPCSVGNDMGVLNDGTPDAFCKSSYEKSKTYQNVFIAGYTAAGAFAATWLVLQLTEHASAAQGKTERASRGPLCGPTSSGWGVSCAVRF